MSTVEPVAAKPETKPSVALNRFKLTIPEASSHPSTSQYAHLSPSQTFSIELGNWSEREADCDLYLDGVLVGHYRVGAARTVTVERPTGVAQRFTFDTQGSLRQFDAHLPLEVDSLGLVKAVFKPAGSSSNATAVPPNLGSSLPCTSEKETHPFEIASKAGASQQQFSFVPLLHSIAEPTSLFLRLIN